MKLYFPKILLQSTSPSLQARAMRIGKWGCNELTCQPNNLLTCQPINLLTCQPVNPRFTDAVTHPTLARFIADEYQSMVLFYDKVLRHRQIKVNKSDTTWNWSFNTPCRSLKGIMALFEEEKPYERDTSKFYNPKIEKVSVIVEGKPNQLYAQRMRPFE